MPSIAEAGQCEAAAVLEAVARLLHGVPGPDAADYDPAFLLAGLQKRQQATASASMSGYVDRLAADPDEVRALRSTLNVAYSKFFRNTYDWALLKHLALPPLISAAAAQSAGVRVWSAGCAEGQEAFSVAMLLAEQCGKQSRPQSFQVIATDISEPTLAAARLGVYDNAALENVALKYLESYFRPVGASFVVANTIASHVDFSLYDLLDPTSASPSAGIYGDFDLILCCNLLFYYRPEVQLRILDKVAGALRPGGYLMTGEVERDFVAEHALFRPVGVAGSLFEKVRQRGSMK